MDQGFKPEWNGSGVECPCDEWKEGAALMEFFKVEIPKAVGNQSHTYECSPLIQ